MLLEAAPLAEALGVSAALVLDQSVGLLLPPLVMALLVHPLGLPLLLLPEGEHREAGKLLSRPVRACRCCCWRLVLVRGLKVWVGSSSSCVSVRGVRLGGLRAGSSSCDSIS